MVDLSSYSRKDLIDNENLWAIVEQQKVYIEAASKGEIFRK